MSSVIASSSSPYASHFIDSMLQYCSRFIHTVPIRIKYVGFSLCDFELRNRNMPIEIVAALIVIII